MKRNRRKAVCLAIGTTALSFAALFASLLICAFSGLTRSAAGIISTAVFAAGEVAAGMALILIPDHADRAIRLVGVAVICLALILVPVFGLWSGIVKFN